jgi:tetratricopeptide (TPR) repeat protein
MTEAVAVVSLAASILTFIDVSNKVLARFREFQSTTREMPKIFQDVETRLPLIIDIMVRAKAGCGDGTVTASAEHALLHVVEDCFRQITLLEELMEKILPAPTDSVRRRALKAIVSVRKEKDVMAIQKILGRHERTLTLHFSERARASAISAAEDRTYYEIPSLQVSQFVGRAELLREIEREFGNTRESSSRTKIVVLLGMGGQGKTQIALEYCRTAWASGRYQSIFWIDASSPNTVSRGIETVAAKISSVGRMFDDVESRIAFVRETLGRWQSPWLMVFDNYDQPSEFRNITTYIPQGETGSILFTSRHADSERLGITIKVMRMTEDEGLELLLRQSKLERNDDNSIEGKEIVEKLGYLPLAIDQAGAYISTRKLPLRLFTKHYNERKEAVLKYTPSLWEYWKRLGEDEDETLLSVFTTWELSFQQISKSEDKQTMISHFLTLSAFFDTTSVSEGLFRSHFASVDKPPQWMKYFVSEGQWDQYRYQDVIAELLSLSLLQSLDIGSEGTCFSMHPLITDWLKLRANQRSRQKYTMEAISILTDHIVAQDLGTLSLQAKLGMLSHVNVCVQNEREYSRGFDESDIASLSGFISTFASLYKTQSRYREAEAMYKRALTGWEKVVGPDHRFALSVVISLGNLYSDQGRLVEAEAMYERALIQNKKVLGPEHISTLGTVCNLGLLYMYQGRFTEAESMLKEAQVGFEKILDRDHTSVLKVVGNLGNLYQAQGRFAEAEAMYGQVLAGFEKTLGPDHVLMLRAVGNLGDLYSVQGRLTEAEAMYRRTLVGLEKTLGSDHRSTSRAANNLGCLYLGQNRFADAEAMFRKALAGLEEVLGPDHPSTLISVNNLGNLHKVRGRLAEAEAMHEWALAGFEKVLGPDHTSTLQTINNLGRVYSDQSRLAEAEAMYKRAVAGFQKTLGPRHTSTLNSVNDLGNLYKAQGRLAEAEAMHRRHQEWAQEGPITPDASH